jgi:hypothetical protein
MLAGVPVRLWFVCYLYHIVLLGRAVHCSSTECYGPIEHAHYPVLDVGFSQRICQKIFTYSLVKL